MSDTWEPSSAEVRLPGDDSRLDGEAWPEKIELVAWERNDRGERRIKATRLYRLEEA